MSLPSFFGDISLYLWKQGKGTFSKDNGMHVTLAERIREWTTRREPLLRLILLIIFLYLFISSLELMSTSLKMFGKEFARSLIYTTTNPVAGLFIGILATSIIQSSSSTTSIVVGMVASGALEISSAIPIIMGANIGTSVTNTLVSLPHINRSNEFNRAFSAAIVDDVFNIFAVLVLFPIQIATNFLTISATFMGEAVQYIGAISLLNPVKMLTYPLVDFLKEHLGSYPFIIFILSLLLLLFSLKMMFDALRGLVVKKAELWFDRFLFKTAFHAFLIGLLLTAMVQSSSMTTSLIVPMAGAGILTLKQVFPYALGSNVGTTVTAIIAALVTGNLAAITVAFSHLLFNISGIIIWWPLKCAPIFVALSFSQYSMRNKIIPVGYIIIMFFIVPLLGIYFFR
jgi:sodium-dependent phosphate cotransporter